MSIFCDIIDKIKSDLSQAEQLSSVKIIDSDRNEKVPNPIKNFYASLGINKISIQEASFNSFLGTANSTEHYGNLAQINLEMIIFSPGENGAKSCFEIFSKIYELLLYQKNNFNIENISCEKVSYNSDVFSFELVCNIKINAYLVFQSDDIDISDIQIKKVT